MPENKKPGPTGEYPDGKLHEDDKGEIKVAIIVQQGRIIIDFGTDLSWVGLDPDHAIAMGSKLVQLGTKLKYG